MVEGRPRPELGEYQCGKQQQLHLAYFRNDPMSLSYFDMMTSQR